MTDFEAVVHIRDSTALEIDRLNDADYRVEIQRTGFLLPTGLTVDEYRADLSSYLAFEKGGEAIGYLCLHDHIGMSSEEVNFWFRPDLNDAYNSGSYVYIYGIGVLPDTRRLGVASELLKAAENEARKRNASWLFSMIVISPVTNIASMMFHERNDFERAAVLNITEEVGLKGFQNLVYAKPLI